MRQPTTDFAYDPFASPATEPIGEPTMTPPLQRYLNQFTANNVHSKAHKFCGVKCVNLSAASFEDSEKECFNQCVNKYTSSFNLLLKE